MASTDAIPLPEAASASGMDDEQIDTSSSAVEAPALEVRPMQDEEEIENPGPTQAEEEGETALPPAASPVSASDGKAVSAPQGVAVPLTAFVKPEKPKKAVHAYWLYNCAVRVEVGHELKERRLKSGAPDVAKEISERWKTLPEGERKVYEEKAAADRQRYEAEMEVYADACDPTAALRRKYKHLIPKRPPTPVALFIQDATQRAKALEALKAEGKETGERHMSSKLNGMWSELSLGENNFYLQEHTKLQLEFLGLQKAWQATPECAELERADRAREEMEKAVELAKAAAGARQKQEEERVAKKRARPAAQKADETTPKRAKSAGTPQSGAKPGKAKDVVPPRIDDKVLKEASKLGFASALQNLASRAEVASSRKSGRAILDALKATGGLVNPAQRALLGR